MLVTIRNEKKRKEFEEKLRLAKEDYDKLKEEEKKVKKSNEEKTMLFSP